MANTFSKLIGSTIHIILWEGLMQLSILLVCKIFDENNKEVEFYTIRILFLRFLVNGQGIKPTGKDVTYKDIRGGLVYYPNFSKRTIERL